MRVTLTAEWLWMGVNYGPGSCEVPQALADALGLTEQQAEAIPPAAVSPATKPTQKRKRNVQQPANSPS